MVDDDYGSDVHAANLEKADEGYRLCDTCQGEGTSMVMVCYGGSPCEKTIYCEDCDGEGQVELPAPPTTVLPQRVRDW